MQWPRLSARVYTSSDLLLDCVQLLLRLCVLCLGGDQALLGPLHCQNIPFESALLACELALRILPALVYRSGSLLLPDLVLQGLEPRINEGTAISIDGVLSASAQPVPSCSGLARVEHRGCVHARLVEYLFPRHGFSRLCARSFPLCHLL